MLQSWASVLSNPWGKAIFMLVGFIVSAFLVPWALLGIMVGISAISGTVEDIHTSVPLVVIPFVGLLGITAAWIRILVPSYMFSQSPTLLWTTIVGLSLGTGLAGWIFFVASGFADALLGLGTFLIGGFFLGATVGERKNAL